MLFARARRLPVPLRLLLLALLAFAAIGSPLASALADVHLLAHDGGAGHAHEVGDDDQAADGESGGELLLHALVHCGHCHGQGGMLALAAMPSLPTASAQACPDLDVLRPLRGRPGSPFRPPIAA